MEKQIKGLLWVQISRKYDQILENRVIVTPISEQDKKLHQNFMCSCWLDYHQSNFPISASIVLKSLARLTIMPFLSIKNMVGNV